MTLIGKKFLTTSITQLLRMQGNLHRTCRYFSYEPDGKTTVTVLNKNFDYGLMIDNVSEYGFMLNNGMKIIGPMIIFPKTMLSWNIASSSDMCKESFLLFLHLEPLPDIVIIGLDENYPLESLFLKNIKNLFKEHKISTEVLPVHQACSTFNFLNAENRYAAAALIPPKLKSPEDILLIDNNNKLLEKMSDPFFHKNNNIEKPNDQKLMQKALQVRKSFKYRNH